ncbi:hypothetical protein [Lentibacillus salicampi]|uniref:Uncharacterized protein n=1 Tax=Lentibacillus salicampi TaxID=175306 RepID=A0A4Y9A8A6_9BACI|nr:hypothetical protein [Lentibacillus salicampi]TFJ92039.1 hypothetical protein E4U82_14600 [Lentibacillus salicampi]
MSKRCILTITASFVLTLFVYGSPVFAETTDEGVIYQSSEIKDVEKLFERAKHNISDIPKQELPQMVEQKGILKGDKTSKEINSQSTTQLLKKEIKPNDAQIQSFATTSFNIVTGKDLDVTSRSGRKYGEDFDSSYGVRAYSTLYYDEVTDSNGKVHYDLTRVSGGWDVNDPTFNLSNQSVNYGAEGWSSYANGYVRDQNSTRYLSGFSYTYYTPSSWYPITFDTSWYIFGMNSYTDISKSGDTWELHLQNQY